MHNEAIMILYLNTSMVNNLFTVLICNLAEIKSLNIKNLISLNIKAPLSELFHNDYNKSIPQGDFSLQILNESSKQKTSEKISMDVVIFMELINILEEQNIIKHISTSQNMFNLNINDYVQFTTSLTLSPLLQYIENLIKLLKIKTILSESNEEKDKIDEIILQIEKNLNYFKKDGCIKFISSEIFDSKSVFIVIIQEKYMQDTIECLNNPHITVVGKVINICSEYNSCFAYVDESEINKLKNQLLGKNTFKDFNFQSIYNNFCIVEIVPLAIYI